MEIFDFYKYLKLANEQRDWLLGNNAWGTTFVVGDFPMFPRCLQHQVKKILKFFLISGCKFGGKFGW
jgi:hypothetical protein